SMPMARSGPRSGRRGKSRAFIPWPTCSALTTEPKARDENMSGTLILVRHGQSEWNLKNLFTGWRNPNLTEKGEGEARATGKALKAAGIVPDFYYTSALRRAQHTLDLMLEEMGILNVTIIRNIALNERDYGDLSGLNKDDAREKWGEEQ